MCQSHPMQRKSFATIRLDKGLTPPSCRSCSAHKERPPCGGPSVTPITTKSRTCRERREVPIATNATQHDRRKRKTANCGGLSEIRSGVLVKSPLEPSASCAEQADPTREARSKE